MIRKMAEFLRRCALIIVQISTEVRLLNLRCTTSVRVPQSFFLFQCQGFLFGMYRKKDVIQ